MNEHAEKIQPAPALPATDGAQVGESVGLMSESSLARGGGVDLGSLIGEEIARGRAGRPPVPTAVGATDDDIDAQEYRARFAEPIGHGVSTILGVQPLQLGSRYLTLTDPIALGPLIAGATGAELTARLGDWMPPDRVTELINAGRPLARANVTDGKTTWIEDSLSRGPGRWFPDVSVVIARELASVIAASLERIVPRYLDAALATALAAEDLHSQSLLVSPKPRPTDVVPSRPIDRETIRALIAATSFDFASYRREHPEDHGRLGRLRPVVFQWEAPQDGTYWIRVSSPLDPSVEEVAAALFGSPIHAGDVAVAAAPLFGIDRTQNLLDKHRAVLSAMGADLTRPGDAVAAALAGPFAADIARNQARGAVPTARSKAQVIETLGVSLAILDTIDASGATFGAGHDPLVKTMAPLRRRLLDRVATLTAGGDEDALSWAAQVEAQEAVLIEISFGFARHATRLRDLTKMVSDATAKLGGFSLPPRAREAMETVAIGFADAAAASELPENARALLARTEERAGVLPVELLEGALVSVQRIVDDARSAKKDGGGDWDSYDVAGMRAREQDLRVRLTRIRGLLRENPALAAQELTDVQALVQDLHVEAEMVGNMDQIDAVWQALTDSYSVWFSTAKTTVILAELKREGVAWHERWKHIFAAWKAGDPNARQQAKLDLDALRKDPKLAEYFGKIGGAIEDAQRQAMIGRLVAMLVITVVTAGIGDLVAAGAAGWGLSAGGTALVAGGAEALAFTTLSQVFLDDKHGISHIAYELTTNWAMFGLLRRFQLFAEVAKLPKVAAAGGQLLLLGASTFAKAELDKVVREGRHLTGEEITQIALQGVVMFIAMHAIAPVTKPLFAELEGMSYGFGAKLRANNKTRAVLAAQAEALKGTRDFEAARAYVAAEKAWLEQKLQVVDEVAALSAKQKKGAPTSIAGLTKMSAEDLAAFRVDLQGKLTAIDQAQQPLLYLEPKGPGLFTCPATKVGGILPVLGETVAVEPNPANAAENVYTVKTPDGESIRVMEVRDLGLTPHDEPDVAGTSPDAAEKTRLELARIRKGTRGKVRDESELTNDDVALSLNEQLQRIKPDEVGGVIGSFPAAEQAQARAVLARASGFGHLEALNPLRKAIEPHLTGNRALYVPGRGSLADNIAYMGSKGSFDSVVDSGKGNVRVTPKIKLGTVVILDEVVLAQIKSDPEFAQSLIKEECVLLEPRGFNDGVNMFNAGSPKAIHERTAEILTQAQKIFRGSAGHMTFDQAITEALDANTRATLADANPELLAKVEVVDPAQGAPKSNAAIADQLNGPAGITAAEVEEALAAMPEEFRNVAREMLAREGDVYSMRRLADAVAAEHAKVMQTAATLGVKPENVYFLVPTRNTSFGMIAMIHRETVGVPPERYLNSIEEIAERGLGPDTMVVVLDDVAGSGMTLEDAARDVDLVAGYRGRIMLAPMMATVRANDRFNDPDRGWTRDHPNVSFISGQISRGLRDSPLYQGLPREQQLMLSMAAGDAGFADNALNMAFPHMAPDNNNGFFGALIAKYFILNRNRNASKALNYLSPQPTQKN